MDWIFKRDVFRKETFLGDIEKEEVAQVDLYNSSLDRFRNPQKKMDIAIKGVGKNELMLGCTDDTFTTPACIQYDGKSFGMLIVAPKGVGKTQLIKHIGFSQMYIRFHYNLFIVDPRDDYTNLNEPLKNPELVSRLLRFGIKPRAFEAKYYKPAFANMQERKGEEYIVTLKDFKSLDQGKRTEALGEYFNVDDKDSPASRALKAAFSKGVPETIDTLFKKITDYKKDTLKERVKLAKLAGASTGSKMISSAFERIIQEKVDQGIFGDDGHRIIRETAEIEGKTVVTKAVKVYGAHFAEDLSSGPDPKIVVLQTDLAAKTSHTYSCYVKMAIAQIWSDRYRYYTSEGREGIMSRPTFVLSDEADVLIPRAKYGYSPSGEQYIQLLSKGRPYGWGVICITQQPEMISQEFIRHTDYIVSTRVQSEHLIKILKERGLAEYQIEELRHLKYNKNSPVKEWFCTTSDPEKPYVIFTPVPPQVDIKTEKAPSYF